MQANCLLDPKWPAGGYLGARIGAQCIVYSLKNEIVKRFDGWGVTHFELRDVNYSNRGIC